MKRRLLIATGFLAVLAALGITQIVLGKVAQAQAQNKPMAPRFEVDPFWPQPMPNHWLLGNTIGVHVDEQDNVWLVHRGAANLNNDERGIDLKIAECCTAAPPVLVFDKSGKVVRSWGGPGQGFDWPASNHGIWVDHTGNVWIGGNGAGDSHIVKFTRDGKFVAQYGKPKVRSTGKPNAQGVPADVAGSNDPDNFGRVAKVMVDAKSNEAYVADGYLNHRVAVLDAATGKMKRYWGAYGAKPDDTNLGPYDPAAPPAKQFRNPVHCAMLSTDQLVYVCDRVNDRIQVFRPDGTFVKEIFIAKNTRAAGSVWDIAFSRDPQQRFIYLADGQNDRVYIIQRDTLQVLTSFGDGGRYPGQFFGVHSIAVDSQGNIYTTETYEGKRVQKFVYKGLAPVTKEHQGTVWPTRTSQ
jgi:DNA-binding beta-propeller fold protein YncE